MMEPGRSYSAGNQYRYGFNGKEQDNEISGQGNQYDYGFRIYNPRIGRFLSIDPLFKSYPWYTPYQFAGNMPIWAIDLDGLEEKKATEAMATDVNGFMIQKIFKEYNIRQAIVNDIYASINNQIVGREGTSQFRTGPEEAVIKAEIAMHVNIDLDENYVAVCDPDTKEPGIFYSILKESASFVVHEAQPFAAKTVGVITYKVGDLLKRAYSEVESYTTKFYKKYFPEKYAEALAAKTGWGKVLGKSMKGLGTGLKATGKVLDIFGTVSIFYDVLSGDSPTYRTNDDIRRNTRERLKAFLETQRTQQNSTGSSTNQTSTSSTTNATSANPDNSKTKKSNL